MWRDSALIDREVKARGAAEEMENYVICELFQSLKWPRNESRAPLGTSIIK